MSRASSRAGRYLLAEPGVDDFWAFHPRPLPPDPPIDLDANLQRRMDRANQALGRLDGVTLLLPHPEQLLYAFVRKEAVLSSQIEGTQSSLSDLLLFENDAIPGVPMDDVRETANYIAALDHGMDSISSGRLPLCNRLLREMHARLLRTGRGADRSPGEFRRSQNWLGGSRPGTARYVPPPWPEVAPAMGALERFLHDDPGATPVLIKAGLAHAQFESIHPFLDGNGRIGRLLITLVLGSAGVLERPLLYLSLYLKQHRDAYYQCLQAVRTHGAWEEWLAFLFDGVIEVAESTTATTARIVQLIERDRQRIAELGRGAATALRLHEVVTRSVVVRPPRAATELGLSEPPVYQAARRLEEIGVLREVTGRQRNRIYVYDAYLEILNEGT